MALPTLPPSVVQPWGDESSIVASVIAWAQQRVVRSSDPKATARSASELAAATGPTVTPEGIGYHRALQLFDQVLVPATRAQDDPMNLAYIASAPTRAAIAFDLATSAANILASLWESGAGVFIVVVAGGPRLGDVTAGSAGELFGVPWATVAGGLACALLVALLHRAQPRFARYDSRTPEP